jgi:hypothetical protein
MLDDSAIVVYRSAGCGLWGVFLRTAFMPLEKIALFANSAAVSGSRQLTQATALAFRGGLTAPYRVIGPASITSWFLQYSTMTFVFQICDTTLSEASGLSPVVYGTELEQPQKVEPTSSAKAVKDSVAAFTAGGVEAVVSNRAEAQRFFGFDKFKALERRLGWRALPQMLGPGFAASTLRNGVMMYSAFVATPILYAQLPKEYKGESSFFSFAIAVNMFAGNTISVTQQSLWGRTLEAYSTSTLPRQRGAAVSTLGGIEQTAYRQVIANSLRKDGVSAFITPGKWASRVLMNAPTEGTLPWFYNRVLPLGEERFLQGFHAATLLWRGASIGKDPTQQKK